MIQFLKDRMSSISSDLYEEILKPNNSHTNWIIQIILCKTTFKKTGLYEYVYIFLVDYDSTDINILDIHKYLIFQIFIYI